MGYSTYLFTKTSFNLLEEPKEVDYEDAEIVETTPIRKEAPTPIAIEAPKGDRSTSNSPFSAREIEVATMLSSFKKQDEMKMKIEKLEREALEREDEVNNSFNDEFQRRLRRA